MTTDQLLRLIDEVSRGGTTQLDLSSKQLTHLPRQMGLLKNLTELNLSGNQLSTLPSELGYLKNLSQLDLSDNQLSTLPAEIGWLRNLLVLDLSENKFSLLPPAISQLKSLSVLDLGKNQLSTLPPAISQLRSLSVLDLGKNQLSTLPADIAQLQNLSELNLRTNQLSNLPAEIVQLNNLSVLYLSDNPLRDLPVEIAQLQNLSVLHLSKNQLKNLPTEIAQLQRLSRLDLSANQLKSLPVEITQLKHLSWLDLNTNQLSSLPTEIGQLKNLTELYLSTNQLSSLPTEIGQLKNLTELYLSANQLSKLPTEISQLQNLSRLDLSANQLSELPTEISQVQRLSWFDLSSNPALALPPEMLNKRTEPQTIIDYYLQNLAIPSRPLNEAKVLLVGEAKVGKTSLVKRLIDDTFDPAERMTEGINIRAWPMSVRDQTVKLNVWDFGGQEIMHATHQFFLTKRSLYLLVLNARQDEDGNRIEYWLKIIRSFSGNSPVIVVGNQADQKSLDIDRRGLKRKYPNIVGFIETSCSDPRHRGIDKLKREIQAQISELPHVFDQLPETWFAVKAQLEQLDDDYIKYHQYEAICAQNDVDETQSQKTLIGFLHDLGIALNFRDDPRLQQDSVLNPEWVTNGVYSILNDNALITQHKGILDRPMLPQILDEQRYPADKHLFILDIMRKFELCFPLEGFEDTKYLLPDLLSKEEPETGDWQEALPFQYHYNILPSSIISRFIVRMNQLISKRTYWRSGVVLARGGNKALVKADREDRKIFIWVSGTPNTRRILLESIRDQFDYIHRTIPGLEVEEKVPLPNNPTVLVDYKHLLNLEALGEQEFVPSGLREKIRVRDLLEGIETPQRRESQFEQREPSPPVAPQTKPKTRSRGPWKSGWFYLLLAIIGAVTFTLIAHFVPDKLVIIIIGALLMPLIIAILQFVQDGKLSASHFVTLITEAYQHIPGLGSGQDSTKLPSENNNED